MWTYNTDRLRTDCPSMDPEIPSGYSFKQLRSWTSFEHSHPVRCKWAPLEALCHLRKNMLTYIRRHKAGVMLTPSMTSTWKMESPMRSAGIC